MATFDPRAQLPGWHLKLGKHIDMQPAKEGWTVAVSVPENEPYDCCFAHVDHTGMIRAGEDWKTLRPGDPSVVVGATECVRFRTMDGQVSLLFKWSIG